MWQRLDAGGPRQTVRFIFEDQALEADEGDTLAAALLTAGINWFRSTPVSGSPRGPYCMMGVCFECLVDIDGLGSRQACMVKVEPDMKVRRQPEGSGVANGI